MKKRLALFSTSLLLAAALVLPASAAATTGYSMTIVNQYCYGGQNQDVYFRVKIVANGSTPANKLTIKSTSQYFSAGRWRASYHWAVNKTTYTANGQAHQLDYSYTHEGTNQYNWRIVSVLKAWNGTHVLASKTLKSHAC
jgi:hypothetical protein